MAVRGAIATIVGCTLLVAGIGATDGYALGGGAAGAGDLRGVSVGR